MRYGTDDSAGGADPSQSLAAEARVVCSTHQGSGAARQLGAGATACSFATRRATEDLHPCEPPRICRTLLQAGKSSACRRPRDFEQA
jgi:hypothetical protein